MARDPLETLGRCDDARALNSLPTVAVVPRGIRFPAASKSCGIPPERRGRIRGAGVVGAQRRIHSTGSGLPRRGHALDTEPCRFE